MYEPFTHERLAYPLKEAASLFSTDHKTLVQLLIDHRIHTYTIRKKDFIPAFECDRLMNILLREEIHRALAREASNA